MSIANNTRKPNPSARALLRMLTPKYCAFGAVLSVVGCVAQSSDDVRLGEGPSHPSGGSGSGGAPNGGTTTTSNGNRGGAGQGGFTQGAGGFTATGTGGSGGSGRGGSGNGGQTVTAGAGKGGGTQTSTTGKGGGSNVGRGGSGGTVFGNGGKTATGSGGTGTTSMGGKSAEGGSTSGPITSTCTEANRTVSGNGTGNHCSYTYEYWKDAGNGTLVLKPDGFSLDWSSVNDLLGRKGKRPGSANLLVDYEAVTYQPNGNSYLCVYGWTRNPLVEYYIVESWGNWRPPGGQGHKGTHMSDGGTYDLYSIARNGANINGNGAFTQYWSVRTEKKTAGTITIANHFNAWKAAGMTAGTFYEVSMTVEGYQSSGKADVKFTMR